MSDSGQAHSVDTRRLAELAAADVERAEGPLAGVFLRQGEEGATEILLVRHAHYEPGGDSSLAGDWPLTDVGRQQAEVLGSFLAAKEIHAVYSSPALRTRETAEAIATHHRLKVTIDEELREFKSYVPQGKTLREVLGEAARERFRDEAESLASLDAGQGRRFDDTEGLIRWLLDGNDD